MTKVEKASKHAGKTLETQPGISKVQCSSSNTIQRLTPLGRFLTKSFDFDMINHIKITDSNTNENDTITGHFSSLNMLLRRINLQHHTADKWSSINSLPFTGHLISIKLRAFQFRGWLSVIIPIFKDLNGTVKIYLSNQVFSHCPYDLDINVFSSNFYA